MAIFEWRKFNFFDLIIDADHGKVAEILKDATINCTTNGNNQIIICDSYGCIHIFNRNWEASTFKGHDGAIELCELSRQHNLLITVGREDSGALPVFKIWNLSKASQINGGISAPCVRMEKIALQKPTSIGVSENGHFMAIGFDRGSVSLYRGDISRDRSKNLKTISVGTSPITGIAFKQYGKGVQMFVCSDSGVIVYNLQSKDKEVKTVLDKTIAPTRCCALQTVHGSNETHFMVGRDDAVYCYTIDGRGPCYALEGEKSIIQWFRSHLLTISKPTKNVMSSQKESVLTVIDILNKFIVFSKPLDSTIAILIEFGTCFVITANKIVYHLDEKDLQSKLSLLFKKNLYDIAVRIAKSSQYDAEGLADIFKQYGDHLYGKGNFAGAVEQYTKTIGYLEPSYIIRRFLDSRHINYLTDYLQALHKQSKATADHTTLLLNCFTRLDKTDQLKEFLSNDKNPDLMFDLDVAIKVCRNASVEHALVLAKRNLKYDSCISILTEDMNAYDEALDYISELPFSHAEENLKKYGNILMEKCPIRTTELLKKLCTDYYQSQINRNDVAATNDSATNGGDAGGSDSNNDIGNNGNHSDSILFFDTSPHIDRANAEDFIHLFVKSSPELLIDFLEHLLTNLSDCSELVYNTLIEHYLRRWKTDARLEKRLLEILQKPPTNDEPNIPYDRNHVLILCSTYNFWPGIMHIYEEQKLYHLIVRYYLKMGDYNSLISSCKRLGTNQPSLWLQALTGLRDNKKAPSNLLSQVLQVIAQEKLQSPLQVLLCLAVENGPNLSSVRDYFLQVFQKDNESAKNEEELVEKYRADSVALKNHIKRLTKNPIEFRGTLCDTCNQPLSMPALYFLCQHAYHQDCMRGYSENDKDCPLCHSKNRQLIDALQAQSESRGQHEIFHNLLDRSIEPFSVVAEYFGRGLFNKIVIVEEQDDVSAEIYKLPTQKPNVKPTDVAAIANPYNKYGAGAESKMRLEEVIAPSSKIGNDPYRAVPMPEGRMRAQEQSRYSTSLEANIVHIPEQEKRDRNLKYSSNGSLKMTNEPKKAIDAANFITSNKLASATSSAAQIKQKVAPTATSKNPFSDEADDDVEYDESKNPFADQIDGGEEPSLIIAQDAGDKQVANPFGEYDNNLNPFE